MFEIILLAIALCILISGYVINQNSKYYKYGVTGDAAAYYFHYEDHLKLRSRCLIGSNLKSHNPHILFFIARLLPRKLIFYKPFVLKIIIEILSTIIFGLLLFMEGESYHYIIVFSTLKIIFSDINIPLNENRQFYTFSPRLIGQEFCALFFTVSLISDIEIIKFVCVFLLSLIAAYNSHFSRQFLFMIVAPVYVIHDLLLLCALVSILGMFLIFMKELRSILKEQLQLFHMQFARLKRANKNNMGIRSVFSLTAGEGKHTIFTLILNIFLIEFTDLAFLQVALIYMLFFVLLVSFRLFEFIGEHWRYALYCNAFLVPLCVAKIYETHPELCFILVAIKLLCMTWLFKRLKTEGLGCNVNKRVLAALEAANLVRDNNIEWCSEPFRLSTIAVNFGSGRKASEFPIGQLGQLKELRKFYPCIDYDALKSGSNNISGVSHFLLDKKYTKNTESIKKVFSLKILYEDENYVIYKVANEI